MSISDRVDGSALIEKCLIAIFLTGFICLVFALGRLTGVDSGRYEASSKESYEEVKRDALNLCVNTQAQAECVINAVESARENSHSYQDLYIQKDIATLSFGALVLGVFSTFVSFIGLVYIRQSLSQTSEVLSNGREIGRKQIRAYMQPVITGIYYARDDKGGFGIIFSGSIKNSGLSPAYNIRIGGEIRREQAGISNIKTEDFDFFETASYCGAIDNIEGVSLTINFAKSGVKITDSCEIWWAIAIKFSDEFEDERHVIIKGSFVDGKRNIILANQFVHVCDANEIGLLRK